MPPILLDLILAALILGLTYALMSEGLWGAALMFFNVLFSGIIAFNFYEPLAAMLGSSASFMAGWSDMLCLMALFIVSLVIFRLTTETLAPAMVRFPAPVYHGGRVFFALAGSLVTFSILLLALECAPVHKKILGAVDYKYKPPFKLGLDHEFLGFFQYTTGSIFANNRPGNHDPFGEYGTAKVFDPRSEWLLHHQDARPYGTETVLGDEKGGAEGGGEGGGGGGAAGAASSGGGDRPGDVKIIGTGSGMPVAVPQ
jgi:hypothetical protein